jgi:hypothetical protein
MDNNAQIEESELVQSVSLDVVYHQDKAAIDVQIATAKAFPRSIKRAVENALSIVTMDEATAETCNYSVPRGGKAITGPSVHLAKILAQVWGNMRIEAKVVNIDQTHITSESVCFDLETNLAIKTQVKRSIMQNEIKWIDKKPVRTGKMIRMNDDMITVTGNAANSIALRNAVLSVVPRAVVDKIYNAAKAKIQGDVSSETKLIARRLKVLDALKETYNVTEAEILKAIGRASVDHITADDIVVLIGIGTAIKDGDTTVEMAFRSEKQKENSVPSHEELTTLLEEKEPLLIKKEFDDAKRILDNKEENSYKKLHSLLTSKVADNAQ